MYICGDVFVSGIRTGRGKKRKEGRKEKEL